MIAPANRCQKPVSASRRRNRWGKTAIRATPPRPSSESRAGCRVTAAAIDASGIKKPPTPIERMNGNGMKSSSASPIATVAPEKTTARPAVCIVRTIAASTSPPRVNSSRKR